MGERRNCSSIKRVERKKSLASGKSVTDGKTENDRPKQKEKGKVKNSAVTKLKEKERENEKMKENQQKKKKKVQKEMKNTEDKKEITKFKDKKEIENLQDKKETETDKMEGNDLERGKRKTQENESGKKIKKKTSNKNNVKLKWIEAIKTKMPLRSANKKGDQSSENPDHPNKKFSDAVVEQKFERVAQRLLRKHRSWPRQDEFLIRNNKRHRDNRRKHSSKSVSNNDSSHSINRNKNSSYSNETGTNDDGLIDKTKVYSIDFMTVASTADFQLKNDKEDSTENNNTTTVDCSGSAAEKTVEAVLKSVRNRPMTSTNKKERFNDSDFVSDGSMNSYASTCASTWTPTNIMPSSNNGDLEYTREYSTKSDDSIASDSGNSSKNYSSEVSVKVQDRREFFLNTIDSTIEVEFDDNKQLVVESEELFRNSMNSLPSMRLESNVVFNFQENKKIVSDQTPQTVCNLPVMQRFTKKSFDTMDNSDKTKENQGAQIIDTNSSSNNDRGNPVDSSTASIDVDLENSTNNSIEIELNNNTSDKLIACLAGIDLIGSSAGMENEEESEQYEERPEQSEVQFERNEEQSDRNEEQFEPNKGDTEHLKGKPEQNSIQNDEQSIQNDRDFNINEQENENTQENIQKSNENSHEVIIDRVNNATDNTIRLFEDLVETNTETPPPNLTYYVYQIPYESTEMAIQVAIPSEDGISASVPTNKTPSAIPLFTTASAVPTSQTYELCDVEVCNENVELFETLSVLEDDLSSMSIKGHNLVSEDSQYSIPDDGTTIINTFLESSAKNIITRSTAKNTVSTNPVKPLRNSVKPTETSLQKNRRGRPRGSKNLKPTDENLCSTDIFYCDMCPDKIFKSRFGLKKHINRHLTNEMRQKCTLCDEKPRNLENHMRMKHSNVRHKCEFCEASFKNKENQLIHMRTHTGERPFICRICGIAFRAQATCRKHENRVHRFLKKFRCEICGRSFHSPYLLQDHTYAFHTSERPYACQLCNKTFATRRYLRTHKITHGEKVHKCRHCEKMFALADNRRKHERRFHKIK